MKTMHLLLSALLFAGTSLAIAQDAPVEVEAAPAAEVAPAPVSFSLDAAKSKIFVTTKKDGVGAALAHDHVIRATQITGTIVFNAANAGDNRIEVTVDVPSLSVDATADRKVAALEGELSSDDQASVKKNMLAEDQLNGEKFPKMTFKSTSITGSGDSYTVKGDLTIRGVTQAVSFPATVKVEGDTFHATGALTITHTQFGFEPYSTAFGAIRNSDTLKLKLDIKGNKS